MRYRKEEIRLKIIIIDGQGGKIGKTLVEKLKQALPDQNIIAIGINTIATLAMLKAGADQGATGENPVICNCDDADIIIGPIGIIKPDSLLGEITPKMAKAIGKSKAIKILIPIKKCNIIVVGTKELSLSDYTQLAVDQVIEICKKN